jgi:hypothetical protein
MSSTFLLHAKRTSQENQSETQDAPVFMVNPIAVKTIVVQSEPQSVVQTHGAADRQASATTLDEIVVDSIIQ